MRRLFGLIVTVHLVSAVYVEACNSITARHYKNKIKSRDLLPTKEFEDAVRAVDGCEKIRKEDVLKWFEFRDLARLVKNQELIGCNQKFLDNYEDLCKKADEYINIKKYFEDSYEREIKRCERRIVIGMERFQEEELDSWMQLTEFYSAVKKDDQIFTDLQKDGYEMSEEMMSALGDVWKSKNSNAGDFYRSEAISSLRTACDKLENYGHPEELNIVTRLSKNIEEKLAEYVRHLRLCRRARWASTPNAEKLIKLKAEKDEILEKIRRMERDMGLTPSVC